MTDGWEIVRLQVQREPLKQGNAPLRWYEPSAVLAVSSIEVGPSGVHGIADDGERIIDVHHRGHPRTRDAKGNAGVTIMGTGDYRALRARYGDHVTNGIAGETILVDAPDGLAGGGLPPTLTVQTGTGNLVLHQVRVAGPCVEFSRFCLRRPHTDKVDQQLREAMVHLDGGARGYRSVAGGEAVIRLGDTVLPD